MTLKNILSLAAAAFFLHLSPTMVWAYGNLNEGYQEVTYEELLNELNTKKSVAKAPQKAALNKVSLGVGYVHSFSQLSVRQRTTSRSQNGLQVAGRMNLDSPNLYAEGVIRNFSGSSLAHEDLQILQTDARLGFMNTLSSQWKYTLFTGFSGRLIQASNAVDNYSVNEFTPSITAGTGVMAEIHKNIRLGVELGGRTSILGKNTDKNSVDFALRLDTSL